MAELTPKVFADWLPPSDVLNWYYQHGLGDNESVARVTAMLRDGLLRAAAAQMIVDGRDLGLTIVPRELWEVAIHPDLWSTGRFRVRIEDRVVSAYDIRIDREPQTLSPPQQEAPVTTPGRQPLSEARLRAWADLFNAAHPTATEAAARASLDQLFPGNGVSRERLREMRPPGRRRGRPYKSQEAD